MFFLFLGNFSDAAQEILPNPQIEEIAKLDQSEIVYGQDANGNKVILGVILKGAPEDNDEQYLNQIMEENHEEASNFNWVGAQEECVSSNEIKQEAPQDQDVTADGNEFIKVYQVNRAERKTLKKLKMQLKR